MNLGVHVSAISPFYREPANIWIRRVQEALPKRDVVIVAHSQNTALRGEQDIAVIFFDYWITQALHIYNPPKTSLDSPTAEIKNLDIDSFTHHVNHMPTWQVED
jgi:hypothetical protein